MSRPISVLKYLPFYLLSLLPIPVLLFLSDCAYVLIYRLIGYRKGVVRANLTASFPEASSAKMKEMEKNFYRHFCDTFILTMKVLTISPKKAKRRITFTNLAHLESEFEKGNSLIMYGAHFGNWEWYAFLPLHIQHQFVSFYQEQSSKYFNDLSVHTRERFGNICVESRLGYKKVMELNRAGTRTLTYMIGDQSPMAKSSIVWTEFLNQQTGFLVGAGRIATKAKQGVVYPNVRSTKRGFYEVDFQVFPPFDSEEQCVKHFANLLEENIREQPHLWLWTHRRWKMKPPKP